MNTSSTWRLTFTILAIVLLLAMVPLLQSIYAAGPWRVALGGIHGNSCSSPSATCASINGAGEIPTRTAIENDVSPVTDVVLSGPHIGYSEVGYSFTATAGPVTATLPITYTWEATGHVPVTDILYSLTDIITFTWNTTGTKSITATAMNIGGEITSTHNITLQLKPKIYLPLISKPAPPPSGIYGKVTENGAPAANVRVTLSFYDGAQWSTVATTYTQADGAYSFVGALGLDPGQRYAVVYFNAGNASRLGSWTTRQLNTYTAGSTVSISDFDIANIVLVAPAAGATVSLPYTFQWSPRSATPSDSYAFRLTASSGNPVFMTDPSLGYVSSYILNTLPPGFSVGPQYSWTVRVYAPDGGYGTSYGPRTIAFTSAGLALGRH